MDDNTGFDVPRRNRQLFDASSQSITFNEEYGQYPNIIQLRTLERCVCNNHFCSFLSSSSFFFFFFFALRFVGLILHFSLQKGSGGTDYMNLMESVGHELEYSSFFSLSFELAFMYILRSRRRISKEKMTLLLPATCIAIPVDSVTCLIFEPVKIIRTYVTLQARAALITDTSHSLM